MKYRYVVVDMKLSPIPKREEAIRLMEAILAKFNLHPIASVNSDYPKPENAYTCAWILSESHAILHTAPEDDWVEVVVATCQEKADLSHLESTIVSTFGASRARFSRFEGSPPWET